MVRNGYVCAKCGQSFNGESEVREHCVRCKVHAEPMPIVDRACPLVTRLIITNEIVVYKKPSENPIMANIVVTPKNR